MKTPYDLSGRRFGRLSIIKKVPNRKATAATWLCRCDCGNEKIITGPNLRRGATKSCGCLRRDMMRAARTTHGGSYSPTYNAWSRMKGRCHNPNSDDFPDYGGRGITVCERWRDNYKAFLADMGQCPPEMSIDRINNDGNYEPSNCRWATATEQANNKRNVPLYEFNGQRLSVAEWSRHTGISTSVLSARLSRGWTIKRALTTPAKKCPPRLLEHNGEILPLTEWGRRLGTGPETIAMRIKAGWTVEQAVTKPVRRW